MFDAHVSEGVDALFGTKLSKRNQPKMYFPLDPGKGLSDGHVVQMASVPQTTFKSASPVSKSAPTLDLGSGYTGNTLRGGGGTVAGFDATGTESELNFLRDQQLKAIGKEYESENKRLGGLESTVRDIYNQNLANVQSYYPQYETALNAQKQAGLDTLASAQTQRQQEAERAQAQARGLLNDLNRRQQAYMSATGTYGSAVPEAFGEQFGRKAYEAQNQIQTSRDQALQEISNKKAETEAYWGAKLMEGKQRYDTLLANLQQQFASQLDQISSAKSQAASAKRAGTLEAWNNFVNNKFSLDQELRNYQTQVMQYAAQNSDAFSTATGADPLNGASIPGIQTSATQGLQDNFSSAVGQNQFTAQNQPVPILTRMKQPNSLDDPFNLNQLTAVPH